MAFAAGNSGGDISPLDVRSMGADGELIGREFSPKSQRRRSGLIIPPPMTDDAIGRIGAMTGDAGQGVPRQCVYSAVDVQVKTDNIQY